ncbi:MAG: MBL fold metallo-hydrolase [Clostridium sp.]
MENIKKHLGFLLGLMLMFSLIGCSSTSENTVPTFAIQEEQKNIIPTVTTQQVDETKNITIEASKQKEITDSNDNKAITGQLKVHFIDVGQADSILVQQGNSSMLIDAGNNGDDQVVKNYLDSQGVKSLDAVIGTHVHEDHIGSMAYIIDLFQVGQVFFPKQTSTTNTFKDFVSSVKNKGLELTVPSVGSTFKIGDATVTILSPNGADYEDANDYSIVVKVAFGNTSFLLTGDAEAVSETQMLSKGLDLSATVLKVGHHGSEYSTGQSFLDKVNPKYAVISVGKNSYGHPTQETMSRLEAENIPVYRTDENGTVVATSNGTNVSFNVTPGSYNAADSTSVSSTSNSPAIVPETTILPNTEQQYIDANGAGLIKGNESSKIYHLPDGSYYNRTKAEFWFKTEAEAQAAGYRRSSR